jgi:hypothetical protein
MDRSRYENFHGDEYELMDEWQIAKDELNLNTDEDYDSWRDEQL